MRKFYKNKWKVIGLAALLTAALPMSAFADVETDEFGVACVLNEDGTRDYNNVPAQSNSSDSETSTAVIYDTNDYDLGLLGPGSMENGVPKDMSAERWAKLNDNTIEWDEIEDLILYWNPTYTKYYDQANSSLNTMRSSYEEFRSQMHEQLETVNETIDSLKTAQNTISSLSTNVVVLEGQVMSKNAALAALTSGLQSAQAGKSQVISALDSTKRTLYYSGGTVKNALKPVKNQMVSVVESLVISYKTLEVNRSLVQQQVELYESLYQMQSGMQAQNLGTSLQTSSYLNQLNTAKKTLAELDAGMLTLKNNIALQCGYGAGTDIVIADLPEPDMHFLDGRNYEADKKTAVDGNSSVIAAGKLGNYEYSSVGMDLRAMGENETRGKANASMDAIHNELQKQLILGESSETSLRKAELTANAAKIKYDMGMVGRAEYEGLKMQYISYQASAKITALNLHQAIENYKYAMLGVMSVE